MHRRINRQVKAKMLLQQMMMIQFIIPNQLISKMYAYNGLKEKKIL